MRFTTDLWCLAEYNPDMAQRRIEHTFDCDVETFWDELFLSEEFNKQLFLERLGFSRWELLKQEETADGVRRVVEASPSTRDIPGPLKRVLKQGLGYREEGEWFRSKSEYTLRVTPNSLPDKLDISGEMRVLPEGTGCRRIYDAHVTARIFAVSGLLESRMLDDIAESYEQSATFSREWLARRKI